MRPVRPCRRSHSAGGRQRLAQLSLAPAPYGCRLGLQGISLSGPSVRSLALRPDRLLPTLPCGFPGQASTDRSPSPLLPCYGALGFTPVGLSPTGHICLSWTHIRTCGIRLVDRVGSHLRSLALGKGGGCHRGPHPIDGRAARQCRVLQWVVRNIRQKNQHSVDCEYLYCYINVRLQKDRPCVLVVVGTTDGALGFWKALGRMLPFDMHHRSTPFYTHGEGVAWRRARAQQCWVHKTANVLDKLSQRVRPDAKSLLHEMYLARPPERMPWRPTTASWAATRTNIPRTANFVICK